MAKIVVRPLVLFRTCGIIYSGEAGAPALSYQDEAADRTNLPRHALLHKAKPID
jgi:hypothetical protein